MIKRTAVIVAAILLLINVPVFPDSASSTEPVPYDKNEFPQWSKDLRRAEIVSFGSLPFVTIGVTMGYGSYLYFTGSTSSFPNPLDKSGNSFSSEEQLKIFGMSLGISCGMKVLLLLHTSRRSHTRNTHTAQKHLHCSGNLQRQTLLPLRHGPNRNKSIYPIL